LKRRGPRMNMDSTVVVAVDGGVELGVFYTVLQCKAEEEDVDE